MMGKAVHRESKLYHVGFDLEDRVPADHPLRAIDRAVDFSFVRAIVKPLYGIRGHESIDPTVLLKLLFLCFYENLRSERELMRQLPMRLDWLWFCGLDLDSPIPDHSVLSKARSRWGQETFEAVFRHVLGLCREAGLLGGRTVYADSTLLKADASLEGRVPRVLWEQLERAGTAAAKQEEMDDRPPGGGDGGSGGGQPQTAEAQQEAAGPSKTRLNDRLVSPVDPEAATTTRKSIGTMLGYRDHRLSDDLCGVITVTLPTPADGDDGAMLPALLERHEAYTGALPTEAAGDSMYGTIANFEWAADRGVKAYLKKRRGKDTPKVSWLKFLPEGCSVSRAIHLMGRRRVVAEGGFAEAHRRMGHRRCRWRGLWRQQVQCYLVAAVQNIKKLVRYGAGPSAPAAAQVCGTSLNGGSAVLNPPEIAGRVLQKIIQSWMKIIHRFDVGPLLYLSGT